MIVPPLAVGDTEDIAMPTVSTNELGLYVIPEGITSFTSMVISTVVLPPLLEAVTV